MTASMAAHRTKTGPCLVARKSAAKTANRLVSEVTETEGLGNDGTTTATGDQTRRNERTLDQATIRRGVRKALTGNKNHESLVDCGNPLPGEHATTWRRDSNGRVSLGNIVRCGSKQLCVSCAGRLRAVDAMLIAWRVLHHFMTGGGVSMMTVAPRHQ